MGIFDKGKKRKGDDFDSPVEQIDLSGSGPLDGPTPEDDDERPVTSAPAAAPVAAAAAPPASPPRDRTAPRKSGYGIDDAIALMRTLPSENVELVVQVVKHTLESTRIEIGAIIEDASDKQARIESRVKVLKAEIADLEAEIATRRQEIESLDADHRETTMVKDRLQLAERLTSGKPVDLTAASGSSLPRPHRPTGELPRPKSATQPPSSAQAAVVTATSSAQAASGPVSAAPSSAASSSGSGATPATSGGSPPAAGSGRPPSHTVVAKK
jgi:hypothetical protein